jgi:hypothetical protein
MSTPLDFTGDELSIDQVVEALAQMVNRGEIRLEEAEQTLALLVTETKRRERPLQPGVPPDTGYERHMMFVD